jgi:hypothetical protein
MTTRREAGKWTLLVLLGVAAGARVGEAQTAPVARLSPGSQSGANPGSNPYASYYVNSYVNPYGVAPPAERPDALLWFIAAQQVRGRGDVARPAPAPEARAAEVPRTLMVPGGGAAGYFNRGPAPVSSAGPRNGKQNRYFRNNGR